MQRIPMNFPLSPQQQEKQMQQQMQMKSPKVLLMLPRGNVPAAAATPPKLLRSAFVATPTIPTPTVAPLPNEVSKEVDDKKWGTATWLLLHTMAEKVTNENFATYKNDILTIIYTICSNLPCPFCSSHAQKYLENQHFTTRVNSPETLKSFLFEFHNVVNVRKHKPLFTRDQLPVYATANFKNIVINFFYYYIEKVKNTRYLATEMFRERVIFKLKDWFAKNKSIFE